jgi:hypothetical protein
MSIATSSTTSDVNPLTLEQLAQKLGPPSPEAVRAMETAQTTEQFVQLGAKIGSDRVATDARRIYGKAYEWASGPGKERKVRGFSMETLRVGVHLAMQLEEKFRAVNAGVTGGSGAQGVRKAAATTAREAGMTLRNEALTALKGVAGGDAERITMVETAAVVIAEYTDIAASLTNLAGLVRTFVGSPDPGVSTRAKMATLDEDYARELEAGAALVLKTGNEAAAPRTGTTNQRELDRMDGINLHVLAEVIHAFDAANEKYADVPRLVPISTRRLLGKRNRKAAAVAQPTSTVVAGDGGNG